MVRKLFGHVYNSVPKLRQRSNMILDVALYVHIRSKYGSTRILLMWKRFWATAGWFPTE
jgi:hypothetical protein